jgi:hypothetical protein
VCATFEQGERVPAATERAVQDVLSVSEQLDDLADEDRRVKCAGEWRGKGHRPRQASALPPP